MATPSLDEGMAKEVLRQVEFYFSDSNIPRDNFMRNTINSSEDGMVSLDLICSFKKMRGYLKLGDVKPDDVSEDIVKAVAETLRKSASLKVSEDGKKVGRIAPLLNSEEAVEQLDVRTIAASPLEHDVEREAVESFFGQYGKVSSVRMPRHIADRRVFCGTALIEFSSEEDAEKVLNESLFFGGLQLELKPKSEFDFDRAKKVEEFENSRHSNQKNNSNAEASYPKGLIVAFALKSMSAGSSAEQIAAGKAVNEDAKVSEADGGLDSSENTPKEGAQRVSENASADEQKIDEDNASESDGIKTEGREKSPEETTEKDEEKEGKLDHSTTKTEGGDKLSEGSIVINEKKGEKSNPAAYKNDKNVVLREDLKEVFEKFGIVKFIDFRFGDKSGYIRFNQPEAAQKARAAAVLSNEGGLIVKNFIATLEPVSGEAERDYWSLLRGNQDRNRENKGNRGRGGKFHRRGGKHPRFRDNDSASGRPNKAQKVGA